jgi:large subunit ribosomal protein L31
MSNVACQFPRPVLDSLGINSCTKLMKKGLHPNYFSQATVTCVCGAVLTTGSTVETMHTEICSQCHPLYTGKKKIIDTTGRVDRFKKLTEKADKAKAALKKAPKVKAEEKKEAAPKKEAKAKKAA